MPDKLIKVDNLDGTKYVISKSGMVLAPDEPCPQLLLLLERLAKPIGKIDDGCIVCVSSFMEDVNSILSELGIPYCYERYIYGETTWEGGVSGDVRLIRSAE